VLQHVDVPKARQAVSLAFLEHPAKR
jgi:hypothetical protein